MVASISQSISNWCKFYNTQTLIMFLYAKCSHVEYREMWEHLVDICVEDHPWLVMGDFNIIQIDIERIGGLPRLILAMEDFNPCLHS